MIKKTNYLCYFTWEQHAKIYNKVYDLSLKSDHAVEDFPDIYLPFIESTLYFCAFWSEGWRLPECKEYYKKRIIESVESSEKVQLSWKDYRDSPTSDASLVVSYTFSDILLTLSLLAIITGAFTEKLSQYEGDPSFTLAIELSKFVDDSEDEALVEIEFTVFKQCKVHPVSEDLPDSLINGLSEHYGRNGISLAYVRWQVFVHLVEMARSEFILNRKVSADDFFEITFRINTEEIYPTRYLEGMYSKAYFKDRYPK